MVRWCWVNFQCRGVLLIWIIVGQGPIALAVGAGGGLFGHFFSLYPFSSLSPSLWETARYRLKYCLKGPLNPKQPTNQLQSISGRLPKRGRKKRERIDESKNVQTTPPAPTARAVGPCPTIIQTSRTPRH